MVRTTKFASLALGTRNKRQTLGQIDTQTHGKVLEIMAFPGRMPPLNDAKSWAQKEPTS